MVLKLIVARLPSRLRLARRAARTTTFNAPAAEAAGEPLSVTRRLNVLVPTAVFGGTQVKSPVAGSMGASGGAPGSRVTVLIGAGRSGVVSMAVQGSWGWA